MTIQAVLLNPDGTQTGPGTYPDDGMGGPPASMTFSGAVPSPIVRGPGQSDVTFTGTQATTVLAAVYVLRLDLTDMTDPVNPVYCYAYQGAQLDPVQAVVPAAGDRGSES